MIKFSRQLLTVWLLAITLLGVQVVQHSAIHDHAQNIVDCGLCHIDGHDEGLTAPLTDLSFGEQITVYQKTITLLYLTPFYHPYQGRSPPLLLS